MGNEESAVLPTERTWRGLVAVADALSQYMARHRVVEIDAKAGPAWKALREGYYDGREVIPQVLTERQWVDLQRAVGGARSLRERVLALSPTPAARLPGTRLHEEPSCSVNLPDADVYRPSTAERRTASEDSSRITASAHSELPVSPEALSAASRLLDLEARMMETDWDPSRTSGRLRPHETVIGGLGDVAETLEKSETFHAALRVRIALLRVTAHRLGGRRAAARTELRRATADLTYLGRAEADGALDETGELLHGPAVNLLIDRCQREWAEIEFRAGKPQLALAHVLPQVLRNSHSNMPCALAAVPDPTVVRLAVRCAQEFDTQLAIDLLRTALCKRTHGWVALLGTEKNAAAWGELARFHRSAGLCRQKDSARAESTDEALLRLRAFLDAAGTHARWSRWDDIRTSELCEGTDSLAQLVFGPPQFPGRPGVIDVTPLLGPDPVTRGPTRHPHVPERADGHAGNRRRTREKVRTALFALGHDPSVWPQLHDDLTQLRRKAGVDPKTLAFLEADARWPEDGTRLCEACGRAALIHQLLAAGSPLDRLDVPDLTWAAWERGRQGASCPDCLYELDRQDPTLLRLVRSLRTRGLIPGLGDDLTDATPKQMENLAVLRLRKEDVVSSSKDARTSEMMFAAKYVAGQDDPDAAHRAVGYLMESIRRRPLDRQLEREWIRTLATVWVATRLETVQLTELAARFDSTGVGLERDCIVAALGEAERQGDGEAQRVLVAALRSLKDAGADIGPEGLFLLGQDELGHGRSAEAYLRLLGSKERDGDELYHSLLLGRLSAARGHASAELMALRTAVDSAVGPQGLAYDIPGRDVERLVHLERTLPEGQSERAEMILRRVVSTRRQWLTDLPISAQHEWTRVLQDGRTSLDLDPAPLDPEDPLLRADVVPSSVTDGILISLLDRYRDLVRTSISPPQFYDEIRTLVSTRAPALRRSRVDVERCSAARLPPAPPP